MTSLDFDDAPARPVWLVTLADLSLLLVGFFVLLQANQVEPRALAAGIRAGFGAPAVADKPAMPVDIAALAFAPGSAVPLAPEDTIHWARAAAGDPRTRLTITGETDGTSADVDPATGSAAILAADRARAAAAILIRARAIAPDQIVIAAASAPASRRAVLTLAFQGPRP